MRKVFQVRKVHDKVEYKLSLLKHSFVTATLLPKTLDKLIAKMDFIHNQNTRNGQQDYGKKDNKAISKRQLKSKL